MMQQIFPLSIYPYKYSMLLLVHVSHKLDVHFLLCVLLKSSDLISLETFTNYLWINLKSF